MVRLEGLRLLRELPAIGRLTSAGASYAEPVLKQSFILAYGSHERFSWPTTLPEFSLNGETERNASIGFCEVPGPRIVSGACAGVGLRAAGAESGFGTWTSKSVRRPTGVYARGRGRTLYLNTTGTTRPSQSIGRNAARGYFLGDAIRLTP